jgi:hypothetical protein
MEKAREKRISNLNDQCRSEVRENIEYQTRNVELQREGLRGQAIRLIIDY